MVADEMEVEQQQSTHIMWARSFCLQNTSHAASGSRSACRETSLPSSIAE